MSAELIEKLKQAQRLLSDVYSDACKNGNSTLASLMSAADDCIWESIEELKNEIL